MIGIGCIALVLLVQFLTFIQGFYMAIAGLDYRQSMVMLRPTFLYAIPFYFFVGFWIACKEPKRYLFFPLIVTMISVLANSLLYDYLYHIPWRRFATDPLIILVYLLITALGGRSAKKGEYRHVNPADEKQR